MARKRKPPEGESPQEPAKGDKTSTKVSVDVHRKASMVAMHRGIDLYEYVDSILRPTVEADYTRMIREESQGLNKDATK